MNSAIGKWMSTMCCACFASKIVRRSKGFTIFASLQSGAPATNNEWLLNDDLSHHLGMSTAVVRVRARLAEGVGVLVIRIQSFGFEQSVITSDYTWDVVLVYPAHGAVHWHSERIRAKGEVIDTHFRRGRFGILALRSCGMQNENGSKN